MLIHLFICLILTGGKIVNNIQIEQVGWVWEFCLIEVQIFFGRLEVRTSNLEDFTDLQYACVQEVHRTYSLRYVHCMEAHLQAGVPESAYPIRWDLSL